MLYRSVRLSLIIYGLRKLLGGTHDDGFDLLPKSLHRCLNMIDGKYTNEGTKVELIGIAIQKDKS
ncbi:Hypothetical protein PAS_chr1-4_0001 [Komagataella phaffii GS115]|uniref:Uncharacterized protein n=1 Tax=Komagataella phaffii (strain GS115 / ATCC 20864) TaxID=644223 RepID=C4QX61_KOMPG|nr:Hypothetical protein PAS_chr1-4_0001 [Komagataella phaffii GS115]CAY67834.1 Hypothetical protein PAS_chr1-4_0001 [Komagataella phaffii GS115]